MRLLSFTILFLMFGGMGVLALVLWKGRRWNPTKFMYKDQQGREYGRLDKPRR